MYRGGRGDYIRGYYRGDPGIFGAIGHFIGAAVHTVGSGVAGAVSGFLSKGPIGGVVGAATGLVSGGAGAYHSALKQAAVNPEVLAAGGSGVAPGFVPHTMPGGVPMIRPAVMPMIGAGGAGGAMGRVMRPSGKGYYTRRHLAALARGLTRARPRLNPFNPQALRRAARRAHSFLRMSRKLVRYYTPKAHKGRGYIKAGRKR